MVKIFVTVDKHQRFKSFLSETPSIRFEHSSIKGENLFFSNFKIADSFFQLRRYDCLQTSIALCSFQVEMNWTMMPI